MTILVRIIIGIVWTIFASYVGYHDGKTIHEKNLTKKERQYINFIEISLLLSSLFVVVLLMLITENL